MAFQLKFSGMAEKLTQLLAVLWGCLRFVIVVFPDHTHLLFHDQGERMLHRTL